MQPLFEGASTLPTSPAGAVTAKSRPTQQESPHHQRGRPSGQPVAPTPAERSVSIAIAAGTTSEARRRVCSTNSASLRATGTATNFVIPPAT